MDYCLPMIAVRPTAANICRRARGWSGEKCLAGQCLLLQRHGRLCGGRSCHCQKPSVRAEADANLIASAVRVPAAILPWPGCRARSQMEKQRSEGTKHKEPALSSVPSGWKRGNRTQSDRCWSPVVTAGEAGGDKGGRGVCVNREDRRLRRFARCPASASQQQAARQGVWELTGAGHRRIAPYGVVVRLSKSVAL